MKSYAYVILETETDNFGALCAGCSDPSVNVEELNEGSDALDILLKSGWVPLRETQMSAQGKTSCSSVVILLVRA